MKRSTLLALLISATVLAAPPSAREKEREALRRALLSVIASSPLKTARLTVQVRSLDDDSVVFSRDADELLNPASNVKLFTSATALTRLGPEYRFETEFLTEGDLKDGRAKVLYVRGKGDPSITTERLYGMVSDLVHDGLKEVSGDVVLDDTWYDAERSAPGYEQESGDKAYLAPTGALSLNWNTVAVYLRPGETVGSVGACEAEPASEYFTVDAQVSTGGKTQRRFTVTSGLDKDHVRQHVEVRGVVPWDKGSWSVWKKIDAPPLYFGYTLKELLKQRGVKVKGRLRLGAVPAGAKMLVVEQSDTLDIVLKRLTKNSSNFIAEQLIKQLGAEVKGAPGTTAKGIDAVEDFLAAEVGLARGSYVMKNGSGLNDTNRFSAAQVNKLLVTMEQRFPMMPEYLSALGIAGKDGTLKYRFEGSDAVGRLRGKTGTLENVSALSGYVQSVGGEKFVFSILVNDFPGRAGTVVRYIDALGAAVASSGTVQGPGAAVASMMQPPSVVGPYEELKARLKLYVGLAQKADKRNAPFLRTAWRSEKDPAVRAVIADALYQSDPREGSAVRIFLDSASASDDVYGRLRKASKDAQLDLPMLASLVELSASGNTDAVDKLFDLVRAAGSDELAALHLAEQLAVVANDAPYEVLLELKRLPEADRAVVLDALVSGLLKAGQPDAPLWATIKQAVGSPDAAMAEFAKGLEATLSQKIAAAKAPPSAEATTAEAPLSPPVSPTTVTPTVPGG